MKILAIGNSFSRDATRYLYQIAKADGEVIDVTGIAIGGCSLLQHYKHNIVDDVLYELWHNGEDTGFKVSMKEALVAREWNLIVIQERSQLATNYDNFQPFLNELVKEFHRYSPKARIGIHETWASETGSRMLLKSGYATSTEKYYDIRASYRRAEKEMGFDVYIPSATIMNYFAEAGHTGMHEDGHHASFGIGRYALALTWYKTLTGNDITNNSFDDFDVPVSKEEAEEIRKMVTDAFVKNELKTYRV